MIFKDRTMAYLVVKKNKEVKIEEEKVVIDYLNMKVMIRIERKVVEKETRKMHFQ